MNDSDDTEDVLKKLLSELYDQAAQEGAGSVSRDSYLVANDRQYLGKITDNKYDQNSILNTYGPYGSRYSGTSIFNQYCPYGGPYGQYSPENPYNTAPPALYLNGSLKGYVTVNEFVPNRIPFSSFIYSLKNDIRGLLAGRMARTEAQARQRLGDTYIEAADGTFLGSLNPNPMDTNSIFNKYGPHGNRFNASSIFNKYGPYGGKFSVFSPFNKNSPNPPRIVNGERLIGYLTTNQRFGGQAIDPHTILEWAKSNVRRRSA
jgi:hypothetical protein